MASNNDDFGLKAYQEIQAQLGLWGEASPSPRRKSPSASRYNDSLNTPATFDGPETDSFIMDDDESAGAGSPNMRSPEEKMMNRGGSVGVQTPLPAEGYDDHAMEHENDSNDNADDGGMDTAQIIIGDDTDSYGPYHNALLTFLQSRERLSKAYSALQVEDNDDDVMQEDDEELAKADAAGEEAEMKFLSSLAEICLLRGRQDYGKGVRGGFAAGLNEASKNEGNFWDLMAALREGGMDSLFYCVNGENPPDLTLNKDPATMITSSPAEMLDACLGEDEDGNTSLPLLRLNAALSWIEACHGRNFDEKIANSYKNGNDPILPPPGRRTMWPATVEAMKRKGQSAQGKIYLDAPLQHIFGERSTSPVNVSSFLASEDEANDARLLRACFMLIQAGRIEEAIKLVSDCGQPWRAASWIGGEPLSSDGSGNPTRSLWKKHCRQISKQMARVTHVGNSPQANTRNLHSSIAYEAAILCLLSDDAHNALNNPVFQTWESGVHAVLRAERGIIVDDVLRAHNNARIAAAEESQTHFPYVGTDLDELNNNEDASEGCDGDLGATLEKLDTSPLDEIREGSADPFRNGMSSFLVGQNAVKEYIEECAALSIAAQNEDEACFLRFIAHLVIYIDSVLPDFSSQLSLPQDMDAGYSNDDSLCELLLLKYISYLTTRRDLWSHVALYCSLLSVDNILETYSSFLINVHSDQERKMVLQQAREFFPEGLDCCILRNVVREMIISDIKWQHAPGEEGAPAGVNSADARKMRSIHWLCYYPEHWPDALVCSNMLLRIFLLTKGVGTEPTDSNLLACKILCDKMLPDDLADVAVMHCEQNNVGNVPMSISLPLARNLKKEYIAIERFLKAHTMYAQFLDVVANTSPSHSSKSKLSGGTQQNEFERGIADKMERNAFRQKKTGLCKIISKAATRASEALMQVISFHGGWLIDENVSSGSEDTEEAQSRSHEMSAIRSTFLPKVVFMLYEVLDKTASWLEQVVYDTLIQFGSGSEDMLLDLFSAFDESDRSNDDDVTMDVLTTSLAAPGYWHSEALSLASVIGNDANMLNQLVGSDMERFQSLIAESHVKLSRCSNRDSLFDS